MMRRILMIMMCLFPALLFAQDTAVIKAQLNKMLATFNSNQYEALIDYMPPKVLQMTGGKQKMVELLRNGMEQMKTQGMKKMEITDIGSPGKFYKAGSETFCLIPQTISIQMKDGKIVSKSNLLAVSYDGGKKWYFLDVNSNSYDNVKKIFPDLSKGLLIPQPTQPVFLPD